MAERGIQSMADPLSTMCSMGSGLEIAGAEGARHGPNPSVAIEEGEPRVPVRVMLVDDHEIITAGLRVILQAEHDIAVVGKATGVKEAVRKAAELKPDVVLMDVKLSDGSGIDAT